MGKMLAQHTAENNKQWQTVVNPVSCTQLFKPMDQICFSFCWDKVDCRFLATQNLQPCWGTSCLYSLPLPWGSQNCGLCQPTNRAWLGTIQDLGTQAMQYFQYTPQKSLLAGFCVSPAGAKLPLQDSCLLDMMESEFTILHQQG